MFVVVFLACKIDIGANRTLIVSGLVPTEQDELRGRREQDEEEPDEVKDFRASHIYLKAPEKEPIGQNKGCDLSKL